MVLEYARLLEKSGACKEALFSAPTLRTNEAGAKAETQDKKLKAPLDQNIL